MKKFAMAAVMALLIGVPALAQTAAQPAPAKEEPKKEEPKKEEPKKDEGKKDEAKKDAEDPYKIYRTKGNSWTTKTTTKLAGMDDMVSYMKTEVTDVTDEKATVKYSMLDKDQKETFSSSSDLPFTKPEKPAADAPKVEAPKTVEETIKVEAGEIECIKVETDAAGTKTTTWMHKKHLGLMVKSTSKNDTMEITTELVKFEIK